MRRDVENPDLYTCQQCNLGKRLNMAHYIVYLARIVGEILPRILAKNFVRNIFVNILVKIMLKFLVLFHGANVLFCHINIC